MGMENSLWGAERIRGELLKLGMEMSKRTIQKYLPKEEKSSSSSQTWATFIKNQASGIWAGDWADEMRLDLIRIVVTKAYHFCSAFFEAMSTCALRESQL